MKKELKDQVNSAMGSYSRIQKKLAIFLVDNWNEIPLMSIETISRETGVSTATITRFVRRFKFKGFYDFKEKIKGDLKEAINPVERFKLLKGNLSGRNSLVRVAKQDIKNINKFLANIKDETFQEIVGMIEKADRVYTFGTSISSIFASMTTYLFNQIQKETYSLMEGDLSVEEKILQLRRDDLLMFFSFYPYSRSTIQYAQLAHSLGIPVVSISDNVYSPISESSTIVLAIPRENILFTTSTSAFSVLVNAIATEIAIKKKDQLSQAIKQEDEILKKFYFLS
jgi:DNA-binding MurR/RpiR family transcriptional regulator